MCDAGLRFCPEGVSGWVGQKCVRMGLELGGAADGLVGKGKKEESTGKEDDCGA
jgi:hypothetical protein